MRTDRGIRGAFLSVIGFLALTVAATNAASPANREFCVDCLQVRVGPPIVVRGPFPDELDATFSALKLPDGSFRGFSANGVTYAIDGSALSTMDGPRRAVLQKGAPGSLSECGRWLTSVVRSGSEVIGLVHQERACDYSAGQTDKSMAIATSRDDGLSWTDLGTVITGTDAPRQGAITGEGDCGMVDGRDGYLYAYCLRNSDWQTIVARAPASDPTDWHKYYEGGWDQPGLGGEATSIGFVGTGVGVLESGGVAAIASDPWFGGLRLSLSQDKVSFADLKEPLVNMDGADWNRPAKSALIAYVSMLDPDSGGNAVGGRFVLSYVYVPPGKGFESRYLVQHEVTLTMEDEPVAVQVGIALTRWVDPEGKAYVTSSGPLTGDRLGYRRDRIVAYALTRPPDGVASVRIAECSRDRQGRWDQMLAEDGRCEAEGYAPERTAGWLYVTEQPGTVPVYRCHNEAGKSHFAASTADCDGLGVMDSLLGYGLTQ